MTEFTLPVRLIFGEGALDALKELHQKRVFLVTDPFLSSSSLLEPVKRRLTGEVEVFDQVHPDPSLRLVAQGVAACRAFGPQVIVAVGGGSTMDCAKAVRHCLTEKPPLWCLPTTAGSGSELTTFAVLTDTEKNVKIPVVSGELLPEVALLEPQFLATAPPAVTANSGLDVAAHLVEAYVAKNANQFSDALVEKALPVVKAALPKACKGDLEAKGEMLLASAMAGAAFNAAGLGLCHAMAHSAGGKFHIPHGLLNAKLLPSVVLENAENPWAARRYGHLSALCGWGGNPRALAAGLGRLGVGCGAITGPLVPKGDVKGAVGELTAAALADKCILTNPKPMGAKDLEPIWEALCQ